MLIAEDIQVEWDEGGCYLLVDGERWLISEPEQLYDRVKAAILPWLMEKWDAERTFNHAYAAEEEAREAYALSDTKHPDHHDTFSAISDERDAFDVFTDEDR